jgi:hypothetical protein
MTLKAQHLIYACASPLKPNLLGGDVDAALAAVCCRTNPPTTTNNTCTLVGTQRDAARLALLGLDTNQVVNRAPRVMSSAHTVWSPPPAEAPPWIGPAQVSLTRSDLGLDESHVVVALCADPPCVGDARRFVFLVALLEALGRPVVGLISEGSWNLPRAARWVNQASPRWRFRVVDAPLLACWKAIDLGVVMAAPWTLDTDQHLLRDRLTRLATSAHAHGVPVIWAGGNPPPCAYSSNAATELDSPTDEPRSLAQRAMSLLESADGLRERGRALADDLQQQWSGAYEAWVHKNLQL